MNRSRRPDNRRKRRLGFENLESRRLLAVDFEFNFIAGEPVGFNHPTESSIYRNAIESAANRLGSWFLHDASLVFDVRSFEFDGSAIGTASSAGGTEPPQGGFTHQLVPEKVLNQNDLNGTLPDGQLQIFFFDQADIFSYQTDPSAGIADDQIDFQAVIIHELLHTFGFTSATRANGSDDNGQGITTPGSWSVFDKFVSDVEGNRFIDPDPNSATAFQMDAAAWSIHSVGGKGPNGGLFFDGPMTKSVYSGRVPLYSPSTFYLESSVSHLDSEGYPGSSFIFSPITHLMSHALVDREVPQELTLLEKAILTDLGFSMRESEPPIISAPANLTLEADSPSGYSGTSTPIDEYLSSVTVTDLLDVNPTFSYSLPTELTLGSHLMTLTASDASGNVTVVSPSLNVVDTTPPDLLVTPLQLTIEATSPFGFPFAQLPITTSATDIVDTNPTITHDSPTYLPIGSSSVTFTAKDFSDNAHSQSSTVLIQDTTAPTFTPPATLSVDSNLIDGADIKNLQILDSLKASAADIADAELTFTASPAHLPFGVTEVTFTAIDDSGNSSHATVQVDVNDATLVVRTLQDELDSTLDILDPEQMEDLSLREAIFLANTTPGANHIVFAGGLAGQMQIESHLGQLTVSESLSVTGLGRTLTSINAASFSRVFNIVGQSVDVSIKKLSITGGSLNVNGDSGAGIRFDSDGLLALEHVVVTGNQTNGNFAPGAGIWISDGQLTARDVELRDNLTSGDSSPGAGLWAESANVQVTQSQLSGNRTDGANSAGAAIASSLSSLDLSFSELFDNQTLGSAAAGGAIWLAHSSGLIDSSTIAENTTHGDQAHGGGVHATNTDMEITNSTVSQNQTTLNASGGGIHIQAGSLNLSHSTITKNTAANQGGGLASVINDNTFLNLQHTILAQNNDSGSAPDLADGGFAVQSNSFAHNLIGDNLGTSLTHSPIADSAGNLIGSSLVGAVIDAHLSDLKHHGGATRTHSMFAHSPAIDAGNPNLSESIANSSFDQRGIGHPRLLDEIIDIGSVETFGDTLVTWPTPDPIEFGVELSSTQFNAIANLPGTLTYTPPIGTRLEPGQNQVLTVHFIPDDLVRYAEVAMQVQIDVNRAVPEVTWNQPASISYGTPLSGIQLNATAELPGSFQYNPTIGSILDAGENQALTTIFIPVDKVHYTNAPALVHINVTPAEPNITWENPNPITYGTLLGEEQLNATANLPGSFTYSPPLGILLDAATDRPLTVTFAPDSPNYATLTKTVYLDIQKATPEIHWPTPEDIVAGQPLSNQQLNATSTQAGAFTYQPAAGTILTSGPEQILSVNFFPNDDKNFNVTQATTNINVVGPFDFGDAPSSYPVLLTQNGARHRPSSLFLGEQVDNDIDGQASENAVGDEDDGLLVLTTPIAGSQSASIASWMVKASESGKLDAWIDFNQDGDWLDSDEKIHQSTVITAGENLLNFVVPAHAVSGETFVRLRLSTTGELSPNGIAADGEVEDYAISLLLGSDQTNASVEWVTPNASLSINDDLITFNQGDLDSLVVSPVDIQQLTIAGNLSNQSITLHWDQAILATNKQYNIDGHLGGNTIIWIGGQPLIDLTSNSPVNLSRFRKLDLTSNTQQTLRLNQEVVERLSPSVQQIDIHTSAGDTVQVTDAQDWRLNDPVFSNGIWLLPASHEILTGMRMQVATPSLWHNYLRPGDVNNDGQISAFDALRIINEISSGRHSDESQNLMAISQVSTWPNLYFDHNADNRVTALDALRVINDLNRESSNQPSGEMIEANAAVPAHHIQAAGNQVTRNLRSRITSISLPDMTHIAIGTVKPKEKISFSTFVTKSSGPQNLKRELTPEASRRSESGCLNHSDTTEPASEELTIAGGETDNSRQIIDHLIAKAGSWLPETP